MKKYKLALISAVILLVFSNLALVAQETTSPKHELGIRLSSFNLNGADGISAIYKKRIQENKYRRFRAAFGDLGFAFDNTNDRKSNRFSLNASLAVGTEKRSKIGTNTTFFRGLEWQANFGYNKSTVEPIGSNYNLNLGLGVGYVLGLQHDFNKHFAINLEAIPRFGVALNRSTNTAYQFNSHASFGSQVALGLMYKF